MRINQITVSGFKNIRRTKLELDGICAVVSPNNYGKSNLIEAIDFGFDFIHAPRNVRRTMMSWVKGIPLCTIMENDEYFFEIEFEDEALGQYRHVRYGFSFKWHRDDETGDVITNEWIEARENTSVRYTSFLKRAEGKYRKGKSTTAFRKIELNSLQLAIDVLGLIEDIEISALIKDIQNITFRICSSLDLRDRYQPSPLEYIESEEDGIKFDDEDVPKALCNLKKKSPELYELFEDAVYTLFPEFTKINLNEYTLTDQEMDETIAVKVKDQKLTSEEADVNIPFKLREHIYRLFVKSEFLNQPVSMANMSTGTKRIIWLLTNAYIANYEHTGILGVEEIETSIHPKMMKQLLEVLNEALDGASLIVSSHSPYLVQYLKTEKLYIGVPNENGVAEFRKIQKNKIKYIVAAARERELNVGEYIFELLSGDSDAYEILESYLEVADN
ncbi:MAG: ATP-binding protein [Lachnospiraceae bacterium]